MKKNKTQNVLVGLKKKIQYFQNLRLARKILVVPAIPKSLEELQTHVLHSHLNVEKLMAEMIRVKVWAKCFDNDNPQPSLKVLAALMLIVDGLQYRRKNEVLCKLEPLFKRLGSKINCVDKLRNKFAHTELSELLSEYNIETIEGAQNIIREYELIEGTTDKMIEIAQKVDDYTTYATFLRGIINDSKKRLSDATPIAK